MSYMEHRSEEVIELGARVSGDVHLLSAKAMQAMQAAAGVDIALASVWDDPVGCSRAYKVNLTSSLTTKIELLFALDAEEDHTGPLIQLKSQSNGEFMALELVKRQIRLSWNVGGGLGSVVNNVTLESAANLADDHQKWYVITAERVANVGRLNVKKSNPVFASQDFHRWSVGESPSGAVALDLSSEDLLLVGRAPDGRSGGKMPGILAKVKVNDQNVGLWNFAASHGQCRAALGEDWREGGGGRDCYSFGQNGYAMQRDLPRYDPRHLSVSLDFRTYDANAIILLIVSDDRVRAALVTVP